MVVTDENANTQKIMFDLSNLVPSSTTQQQQNTIPFIEPFAVNNNLRLDGTTPMYGTLKTKDIELQNPETNYFYFGPKNEIGTWRLKQNGLTNNSKLEFQVNKVTGKNATAIIPSGGIIIPNIPSATVNSGEISSIILQNPGIEYMLPPIVVISEPQVDTAINPYKRRATATASMDYGITNIHILSGGYYTVTPTITITGGNSDTDTDVEIGEILIETNNEDEKYGQIKKIKITNVGTGYFDYPTLTINRHNDDQGNNEMHGGATLEIETGINTRLASIYIEDAGYGYTINEPVTVTITPKTGSYVSKLSIRQ
jgi:hypothetical protein